MRTSPSALLATAGLLLGILIAGGCGGTAPAAESVPTPSPRPPLLAAPAPGTLAGRIAFQPKDPAQPLEPLPQVFVYVKEGVEGKKYPVPAEPVVLDQITFQFVPHVFGIRVGQALKITSQDTSQHNVFCQPFNNPGFNESMFGGEFVEKKFTSPEVMVLLQCNIHHIMKAYAGVLDHPFFTVSGKDGTFEIEGLSPGRYKLAAWQEFMGSREIDIELRHAQGTRIEITYK